MSIFLAAAVIAVLVQLYLTVAAVVAFMRGRSAIVWCLQSLVFGAVCQLCLFLHRAVS